MIPECFLIGVFGLSIPVCIAEDRAARDAAFMRELAYCRAMVQRQRVEPLILGREHSDRCRPAADELLRRWKDPQERWRMGAAFFEEHGLPPWPGK